MSLITCLAFFVLNTNIYNLQFQDIDGNTVSMSQFQNKKILLVNIASGSGRVNQLTGLQQLQQQYGDSLVIIGFPSNSFGHEARSNAEIKQFCQNNYGVTFLLAAKSDVKGQGINSIYQWLTSMEDNGVSGLPMQADFQKFLIGKSGNLIGLFSPGVDPANAEVSDAITNPYVQ